MCEGPAPALPQPAAGQSGPGSQSATRCPAEPSHKHRQDAAAARRWVPDLHVYTFRDQTFTKQRIQTLIYKHSMHEGSYCEYRSSHKRAENMRAHAHSRAHANVNPSTPTLKKLLNFKKVMSSLVLPGSVSHESLIQSQSNRPFYESLTCIEYHIIPYYFKTCSDSDSFVNDAEFMESNGSASLTGINKEKTFSVSMCDVSINKLMSESSRKSYYSGITCVNKQVLCRNLLNPGLSCGLTVEFYHTHTHT